MPDHASYLMVLNGTRTVCTPAFSLIIRPWNRLIYADNGMSFHKVQIEIEGIPPHIWEPPMAKTLLCPYCSVESIHPDTAARRDLSVFKLNAWTTHPELIPETKIIAVLEPFDIESPFQPMSRTSKYTVQIRIRRLLLRLPPVSPPPTPLSSLSSDEDSPDRAPRRAGSREHRGKHRQRDLALPTPVAGGEASVTGMDGGRGRQWAPLHDQPPPPSEVEVNMAEGGAGNSASAIQGDDRSSSPEPQRPTAPAVTPDLQILEGKSSPVGQDWANLMGLDPMLHEANGPNSDCARPTLDEGDSTPSHLGREPDDVQQQSEPTNTCLDTAQGIVDQQAASTSRD